MAVKIAVFSSCSGQRSRSRWQSQCKSSTFCVSYKFLARPKKCCLRGPSSLMMFLIVVARDGGHLGET